MRAYRINSYLHQLVQPAFRDRFLSDPEATFEEAGLTAKERRLIAGRDWRGMIHCGVIFFLLEKLGAVVGVSNLHIHAALRRRFFFGRRAIVPGPATDLASAHCLRIST